MRAVLLLIPLLLSACVLHSKAPLFDDAAAEPILGDQTVTFDVSSFDKGQWVANEVPVISALPEGRHYLVPDETTPADLTKADRYAFIPLGDKHFVVQAEAGGEADYAIAVWDGTTMLVSPLDCAALKTSLKTNDVVTFVNDDCALKPGTPPVEAFTKLADRAGPPNLRLTRR